MAGDPEREHLKDVAARGGVRYHNNLISAMVRALVGVNVSSGKGSIDILLQLIVELRAVHWRS